MASSTPAFYCPNSGVYHSIHPHVALPTDDRLNIVSFLFSTCLPLPDAAVALIDAPSGFSLTHADVRRHVLSLASALSATLGVARNDAVLLLLPNSVLFPVALLGVMAAGAVATTMNPLSTLEEVRDRISRCRPVLVLASDKSAATASAAALGHVPVIAVPEKIDGHPDAKFAPFLAMLLSTTQCYADDDEKPVPADLRQLDDAAAILYSSGTSGPSKGVVITHRNLIAAVELFIRFEAKQYYPRKPCHNVYLAALPMFHVYGMTLLAMGPIALGATAVVMPRYSTDEAVRNVDKYRVSHLPAVPPMLPSLVGAARAAGSRLASLVQVSSGAAPLSKKRIEEFTGAFPEVDFIQGYGLTETTAVGARGFNNRQQHNNKYASVGLLAPNTEAKIVVPDTGAAVPPGLTGELWLRGPGIMKGYYKDGAATASSMEQGGWLKTGDLAYFDQDAYLYVVDRFKDTIKYNGFQIAPADLEEVLISCPHIADAAVTSLADEAAGEIPVGFVVRKPHSSISCAQVMEHVNTQVAPYKRLRRVIFVESIPKSASGKVLRRLLTKTLSTSHAPSAL